MTADSADNKPPTCSDRCGCLRDMKHICHWKKSIDRWREIHDDNNVKAYIRFHERLERRMTNRQFYWTIGVMITVILAVFTVVGGLLFSSQAIQTELLKKIAVLEQRTGNLDKSTDRLDRESFRVPGS